MDAIQNTITKLLDKPPLGLAGSIYIPTSPQASPPHVSADRTRLKNAIQHIKNLQNYDEQVLGDSITKLEDVLDDMEFWQHQDLGLVALFDAETVELVRLPFEVSEAEYLRDHFVVSPLMVMEAVSTNFYLLDMNFTSPRLFRGAHGQLEEVNKEANMPESFEEEVASEEYRRHLQHQAGGVGAYHGHTEKDVVNEEQRRYFRLVAAAVDEYLREENLPLLLAGTDNRTSALREGLSYGFVVEDSYSGNTEHYNPAELYEAAEGPIGAYASMRRQAEVKRLKEAAPQYVATGRDEIVRIAELEAGGRIENLYLPIYRYTRDGVQDGKQTLIIEIPKDIEAIESLVVAVVRSGGKLVPVEIGAYEFLDEPKALCRY